MPSKKKTRVREQMSKTGMSYEGALHSLRPALPVACVGYSDLALLVARTFYNDPLRSITDPDAYAGILLKRYPADTLRVILHNMPHPGECACKTSPLPLVARQIADQFCCLPSSTATLEEYAQFLYATFPMDNLTSILLSTRAAPMPTAPLPRYPLPMQEGPVPVEIREAVVRATITTPEGRMRLLGEIEHPIEGPDRCETLQHYLTHIKESDAHAPGMQEMEQLLNDRIGTKIGPSVTTLSTHRGVILKSFAKALDTCIEQEALAPQFQGKAPVYFEANILVKHEGTPLQLRSRPALDFRPDAEKQAIPHAYGTACLEYSKRDDVYDGISLGAVLVGNDPQGMYYIGETGESVLYNKQSKVVQVPFAEYDEDVGHTRAAIEERVYALLDADAVHAFDDSSTGRAAPPLDEAFAALQKGLPAPIAFVHVNEQHADQMRPYVPPSVRFIASRLVPLWTVYATLDPMKTGGIVEHPDGRIAMYLRAGMSSRVFLQRQWNSGVEGRHE